MGLTGIASATEQIEINVGYANERGRKAALDAADGVKREFGFRALTIRAPREVLRALENNPNVRYAEENGEMHALSQTVPYGIETVNADVAIDDGNTGDGVSVAIIDTGIGVHHEDLAGNLGTGWAADDAACQDDCTSGWFCNPNDISTCYEEWDDDNDHGTHVAGTVGAIDNDLGVLGVSPDVTLHAVKVLDCCGSGSFDDIAAGIEWSANQGHEVQNMSLGGSESSVVEDAVEDAAAENVTIIAAAGNDGECTDCVSHPAAYDEVIAVSATDDEDELASFSSTGPEVELAAPGVDVLSAVPRDDYAEFSGTSMASPHVAGGAAQVVADGTTDREQVRQTLKDSADDIGLGSNEQGAGRLNVAEALDLDNDDDDDDDDDDGDCVDASNWPDGTGSSGFENIDQVDLDGQVVETSADNAYEDFTCPDVVTVSPGGSFQIAVDFSDDGYDNHYGNIFVDWDQNEDWSTAAETEIFENVSDDSVTYTETVPVPSNAEQGSTLARVRLGWNGFDDAGDTGEYGEVNDFTIVVE